MKLYNILKPYIFIFLIVIVSTFVVWLPFLLKINNLDFQYVYKHYDGAMYIIPAKTLYEVNKIDIPGVGFILSLPLSPIYFAAHLPLYPILIRLFSIIFGYLHSMIGVNILFTIFLGMFFYYLVKKLHLSAQPLLLTIVFLFLPRFLVVRSVGAPESLFMFLILLSLYFFNKEKYLLSGIFGALCVMTKVPGILLFVAYSLFFITTYFQTKKFSFTWFYILLIPMGLFSVFTLYWVQYKDFFAFFHSGGMVPMPYPFSVFNSETKWVGTAWLEDIVLYFGFYTFALLTLYKSKHKIFLYFFATFFLATTFVQHRDISRYSLPLWPLACIVFEKVFTSKKFLITGIIILPAIYFYAWNFLQHNIMPINIWTPFL